MDSWFVKYSRVLSIGSIEQSMMTMIDNCWNSLMIIIWLIRSYFSSWIIQSWNRIGYSSKKYTV